METTVQRKIVLEGNVEMWLNSDLSGASLLRIVPINCNYILPAEILLLSYASLASLTYGMCGSSFLDTFTGQHSKSCYLLLNLHLATMTTHSLLNAVIPASTLR